MISPEYPPYGSGIANAVYSIRSCLLRKGLDVQVLSRFGADVNIGTTLNSLPGIMGTIPFWQLAANYIEKNARKYDAIWLHSPLLVSTKKLRTSKIVVSLHTTYWGFYQAYKKHAIYRLLPYYYFASKAERFFHRQLSTHKDAVVTAVSPSVAEEARRNGLSLIPHFVPNGMENIHHAELEKYHARRLLQREYSLKLCDEDRILLYVGRITEAKQPFLLVKALQVFNSTRSNIHLLILGSGNLFGKLRKECYRQQNLHIVGHIPHESLPIFMNAADAFISLSCYEGLPIAVLEAASFNLPLILSNIPAHKWIVHFVAGSGMLVDSHYFSPAEVLDFLDESERERDTSNASLRESFKWENITDRYLTLLSNS
jgi:glycosyltransferase involved in cell wall biosynthesis